MREYLVWVLGEEFRVKGVTRWKAVAEAVRLYRVDHPDTYKVALLMVIAKTRQLPEVSVEIK